MQKVIIIGAGPAGLTAADKLLDEKEKYDVTILEETSEIGGISRTVKYNGNRMDIGGHRFFSKDPEVMKYWEELMPIQGENSFDDEELKRKKQLNLGGPNPNTEDEVMLIRTRVSRIYFLKKFFDYPVSLKWKTLKNMGLLRTIKVGFSYLKAIILKRKENSLEDFYINRFGEELYKMFFKNYTERLWGRKASEISADWGAQRVKGVSINAIIKDMFNKLFGIKSKENTETSLIEQFWYPKFGPGQLWETLAERIEKKGGKILNGYKVKKGVYADLKGTPYYFDKNGYRINDVTNIYKSGYTVEVDRVNGVMTIYADANRTIPVKTIRVSVGNPGTDTPTGRYKLTRYSRWQALMGPSWGQYGTHVDGAGQGGIFVHSIACGSANSYNLPVSAYLKLGSPASHGCIRTCVADAKWVYENCNGSTIYIFDGTYKSDEVFKGPLGRRAITPLRGIKNGGYYDPTDPAA